MNIYKQKKFLNKFSFDFNENKINLCPNFKKPNLVEYEENNELFKAYFEKENCIKCRYKKNCLNESNDSLYNLVYIPKKDVLSKKSVNFNNKFEKIIIKIEKDLKNSSDSIDEIENAYYKANEIGQIGRNKNSKSALETAKEIYKILLSKPIHFCTGGCYVNIAEIDTMLLHDKFLKNIFSKKKEKILTDFNEIENNYLKALEIKNTNQIALSGISIYYFLSEQYDKSINFAKKITDKKNLIRYVDIILNMENSKTIFENHNGKPVGDLYEIREFYKKLYENIVWSIDSFKIEIGLIYFQYCSKTDKLFEAYKVLNDIKESLPDSKKEEIYIYLASLCIPGYLNRPRESIEYYNKIRRKSEKESILINTNKALCYIELKEPEKAISILEKQVKKNPNNTDYFNLAKAYHMLEQYDIALENINKARYIFEDEQSYVVSSWIYRDMGDFDKAIKYAKKALYFMENENLNFTTQSDQVYSISQVNESWIDEKFEIVYDNLSTCYLNGKKFEEAYSINKIALEKYPFNMKFKENIKILKEFINIQEENIIIKRNIETLENERNQFKNEIGKSKEWIIKLIKFQNNNENISDLCKNSWSNFEKVIDNIMEQMKKEVKSSTISYNDIYKNIHDQFNGISKKALSFLATAEYLYQYNKDTFIDFAPIVIEFSKVFEIELNNVLKYKIKKTLGEILMDESIRHSFLLGKILDEVEVIRTIRNGAAHTGTSTKEKVEELRNIIYNTNILKEIIRLN